MKNLHLIPTKKGQIITKTNKGTFLWGSVAAKDYVEIRKGYSGFHLCITSDEEIKKGDYVGYPTLKNWVPVKYLEGDLTGVEKKIILTTDEDLIKDCVQAIDDEFLEWFVKNPSCEEIEVVKQMLCDYCGQEHCDNLRCRGHEDSIWYEIIIPKEEPLTKLQIAKNIDDIGKEEPRNLSEWIEKEGLPTAKKILAQLKDINSKQEYVCYKCKNKTSNKFEICDKCNVGWKESKQETLEEAAQRYEETDFNTTPTEETSQMMIQRAFINGAKWEQERSYSEVIEFIEWINDPINPFIKHNNKWIQACGNSTSWTTKELFEQFKKK